MAVVKPVTVHNVSLGAKPEMLTGAARPNDNPLAHVSNFPPRPGWLLQLYSFSGELTYGGHTYPFHDGCVSFISANHRWRQSYPAETSFHVYSRFLLPQSNAKHHFPLPILCDLAEKAGRFRKRFISAVSHFPENPRWAEVDLWALLFELADAYQGNDGAGNHWLPIPVRHAFRFIETSLSDPTIGAADVASAADVSYSHLALLFRKHAGIGIMDHLRDRRMKAAEELIRNSDIPIKRIAAQVGYPDLQHFNKLVRRHFGVSPTALRCQADTI